MTACRARASATPSLRPREAGAGRNGLSTWRHGRITTERVAGYRGHDPQLGALNDTGYSKAERGGVASMNRVRQFAPVLPDSDRRCRVILINVTRVACGRVALGCSADA